MHKHSIIKKNILILDCWIYSISQFKHYVDGNSKSHSKTIVSYHKDSPVAVTVNTP